MRQVKHFYRHSLTHGVIMLMCRYYFAFEFKRRAGKKEGMKLRVVKMLMILDPPGVGQLQWNVWLWPSPTLWLGGAASNARLDCAQYPPPLVILTASLRLCAHINAASLSVDFWQDLAFFHIKPYCAANRWSPIFSQFAQQLTGWEECGKIAAGGGCGRNLNAHRQNAHQQNAHCKMLIGSGDLLSSKLEAQLAHVETFHVWKTLQRTDPQNEKETGGFA